MKQPSIAQMVADIVQFRAERDWEQFHNPKDMAIGLSLEAAELLELMQWKNAKELRDHLSFKHEALADELADILGWLLLLAHDFEVNLPAAFVAKMKKNRAKYPVHKAKGSSRKYTEL